MKQQTVVITLSDLRKIRLALFEDIAPKTVANFTKLVEQKYYDGLCFHRIIAHFMVQSGAYYVTENNEIKAKEAVSNIYGEFSANGFENNLKHELGVISMARSSMHDSASSQFFICAATCPHLDGQYAAFGKTIDQASNDVILDIMNAPTVNLGPAFANFPSPVVTIKEVRMEM